MKRSLIFWDIECYRNYFYVLFKAKNHTYCARLFNDELERGDRDTIKKFISKHTMVGFNSDGYDMPMLAAFIKGYSNDQLKRLSDHIINSRKPWWMISGMYPGLVVPRVDSIDLIGPTPLQASLKTYGCRIHTQRLQDLPITPDAIITEDQVPVLEQYCDDDVETTRAVYTDMLPDIKLRADMTRQYGEDFRSKSGPQIAEAVLRSELAKRGVFADKRTTAVVPFKYTMPEWITFETKLLQKLQGAVENATFEVDDKGYAQLPEQLQRAFVFDGLSYKIGIGGLHSQEKNQGVVAAPDESLGEWDVASMYPSIILNQRLYPKHIGPKFGAVYKEIYHTRLAAKRSGKKVVSDSLKLVLNSSFGKFGNRYSRLYSPELLIQTTITGQLSLLMLIEMFEQAGIKTVSANTDGVVVKHHNSVSPDAVVQAWQERTGLELEYTPYQALYSESVNNYVALKKGGGVKCKGTYAPASIGKGYQNEICVDAICAYLEKGVAPMETITNCRDIRKFLTMRGIRSGGVWRGQDVGRVARWYISTCGEPIRYKTNGNKVAGSDHAVPMMVLEPGMPRDLDHGWYHTRTWELLKKLGAHA